LLASLLAVWRAFRERRLDRESLSDPRLVGFFASAFLTVLGFGLGAAIRGSTTTIPAHYHAAIGAVTVSFMALAYPLLEAVGVDVRPTRFARRASAWQPALFAIGQSIFAIGFACAGVHGTGRKIYGAEQHARSFGERLGLGVMGLGGLVAITSGLVFLYLVTSAFVRRERARPREASLALYAEENGEPDG
jgi:heme/copper-type cytochrome/quinol oxidase subunit 1